MLLIAGTPGGFTVNVAPFETPPPGAVFSTVTCTFAAAATSAALIAAASCDVLTKLVVRAEPFHCTVLAPTKLDPFTVSVNAALPAFTFAGATDATTGTGFVGITGDVISHMLRPCVAARSLRVGLNMRKPYTAARGKPAVSAVHVAPPSVV